MSISVGALSFAIWMFDLSLDLCWFFGNRKVRYTSCYTVSQYKNRSPCEQTDRILALSAQHLVGLRFRWWNNTSTIKRGQTPMAES